MQQGVQYSDYFFNKRLPDSLVDSLCIANTLITEVILFDAYKN